MSLEAECLADAPVAPWLCDELSQLLSWAAVEEPAVPQGDWQMALRLTTDAEISALHQRFFSDSSPTDVISFPSGDPLDAGSGYLGDVVVSVDTARAHAAHERHALERELAFLALHGLLHLCGYDDATDKQRSAMLARQSALLEAYERSHAARWQAS